jgi:hypothetical protein
MTALRNARLTALPPDFKVRGYVRAESPQPTLAHHLLPSEREFYGSYQWSLNAYPTVESVLEYLREELNRLDKTTEAWQLRERMTNIFLLACAIANEIDDHVVGRRYDLSRLAAVPFGGMAARTADKLQAYARRVREWRKRPLTRWSRRWLAGLHKYLQVFVTAGSPCFQLLLEARTTLTGLMDNKLPADVRSRRLRNPAFFHVRDLTHADILRLGEKLVATYPDRNQPIVFVGLRTAGSYFSPLLRAFLTTKGYQDVVSMTIRPRSAVSWQEKTEMAAHARAGRVAVVLDEPPCSGGSTAGIARMLYNASFPKERVVALFPVFHLYPDWKRGWGNLLDGRTCVLTLEPEEWHKVGLLEPSNVERTCQEYFQERGYPSAQVVRSANAELFNAQLQQSSDEKMHTRLKRVYKFWLQKKGSRPETHYVLAKSVGCGWLGYRAFLAGESLHRFVPTVLGLRDGILYTEWLPPVNWDVSNSCDNRGCVETVADYVATRVGRLRLSDDPTIDLVSNNQHKGYEELAGLLGRAFGSTPAAAFKRPRIQHELARRKCPVPTLVDAKMRRMEWVAGPSSLLKVDFEHHAMGKRELEVTDPAYDLAEATLHFKLSETEEKKLVHRYAQASGDESVGERMFLHKLLAGTWSMIHAQLSLKNTNLRHRYQEFNERYLEAWEFLTLQTMRRCARLCVRPASLRWQAPLIVLDVDGVLDRNVFGSYPCTTVAGLKAISTLHSHDFALSLNSARSFYELQEYCKAYGFVGGVAEYGSVLWNAVAQRETILVSPTALGQLEKLRATLRRIPGVFLNDRYQYSIRAYTFGSERTTPLPTLMIAELIGSLELDRLRFHQTDLDTAVLAKEVDKGVGLIELLAQTGVKREDSIAIGDSEPDLDMFRVAGRSFAPSQIWCRDKAEKLGCQIANRPYQTGLLEIARTIAHQDGKRCNRCIAVERSWSKSDDLFLQLLAVADQKRTVLLIQAMFDPMAIKAFAK